MTGLVCLQGGGEFSQGCREMDALLLERAAGPVVVSALAGAVGREHDTANGNGVRHFRGLGADVEAATDVRTDPDGALAALRRARLLVLPGGSPSRLLGLLQTTGVGAVVRDLLASGGVVSGSSAGAMVLCGWTVRPDRGPDVVAGLGVVPGALVLPHWDGGRADWLRAVRRAVPPGTVLLGVPEESGVLVEGTRLTGVGRASTSLIGSDRAVDVGATVEAAVGTPADTAAAAATDPGA